MHRSHGFLTTDPGLYRKQYDVKNIEEIVYDISLRGLVVRPDHATDGLAFPAGQQRQQEFVDSL